MSGMFRAGAPTPGIQPVAGTIGRKPDGPDRIYGHKPKQNIDQPFDDFSPQPSAYGGSAAPVSHDLWDVIITMTGSSSYEYRVVPSTVNGVVPNDWGSPGTGSTSSALYVSLACSATNGHITSVAIQDGSSPVDAPPVLQSVPPSSFHIALGVIGTDGIFYKFVAPRPITVLPVVAFETDRNPPIPGLSPRIQWWTWEARQPV